MDERRRIVNVLLDQASLGTGTPHITHDRAAAVFDLLEENHFAPADGSLGPFIVHLGLVSGSGAWKVTTGVNVSAIGLGRFT